MGINKYLTACHVYGPLIGRIFAVEMKKLVFVYLLASLAIMIAGYGPWSAQANCESSIQSSVMDDYSSGSLASNLFHVGEQAIVRSAGYALDLQNEVFVCEQTEEEEEDEDEKTIVISKYVDGVLFIEAEAFSVQFQDGLTALVSDHQLFSSAPTLGLYVLFEVFRI